jgi:uncharacterized protein YkwD
MRQRFVWLLSVACFPVLGTGCFSASNGGDGIYKNGESASDCLTADEAEKMADQVLQLVNLERSEAGLSPVVISETLDQLAADYACRMIDEEFFGHRDPVEQHGPGERAVAAKYSFFSIGENLAAGQETPAEVMRVWMESPSHRAIILDGRWTEIGIAVRMGGKHGIYWVQEFGDPANY